jgi:hypothetical protein
MANVICMKWGTKFGPEYVNRLASMVKRHMTIPYRFVCFTDNGDGVDAGVEVRPLPEWTNPGGPERSFRKVSVFTSPLADLKGPTLFLDLDIVVTGSMDDFFSYPGEVCIIKDWLRPWRPTGNSSVFRFEAGVHQWLVDEWERNHETIRGWARNDQEYYSRELFNRGKLVYWPAEWCISFKYGCMAPFPMNWWRKPTLPPTARIVVFHGHPNPPDAIEGRSIKITRHVLPTPWVADHWR